jgi:hypothetical protein
MREKIAKSAKWLVMAAIAGIVGNSAYDAAKQSMEARRQVSERGAGRIVSYNPGSYVTYNPGTYVTDSYNPGTYVTDSYNPSRIGR